MKILVIDDGNDNQATAKAQLKDHETTVVSSYDDGQELIKEKHAFDVVLVDLLLPASGQHQGENGEKFVGQEMPVGIFLALLAAKNGAKYVAVFTDSGHHDHPASACFDAFNPNGGNDPTPFTVEGAKVLLSNARNWINHFRPENLAKEMSYEERKNNPSVRAKNWRKLLDYLTSTNPRPQLGKPARW